MWFSSCVDSAPLHQHPVTCQLCHLEEEAVELHPTFSRGVDRSWGPYLSTPVSGSLPTESEEQAHGTKALSPGNQVPLGQVEAASSFTGVEGGSSTPPFSSRVR